jgi:diguanylate cyclase (GGDEF)-like protein/PAS domain S-box-containing protein
MTDIPSAGVSRPMVVSAPGGPWGHDRVWIVYVAIGIAIAGPLIELVVHGSDIHRWGTISNASLCLVAIVAAQELMRRWWNDRRPHVLMTTLTAVLWASAQVVWVLQTTLLDEPLWPGPADVLFVLAAVSGVVALILRLHRFDLVQRRAMMADAAVMSIAISFVIWELWIRDGVADLDRSAQIVLTFLPMLEVTVASMAIVVVLQQYARTQLLNATLWSAFAAGDVVFASAGGLQSTAGFIGGYVGWVTALVIISFAAGVPSVSPSQNRRPEFRRILAVSGFSTIAIGVAMNSYLIGDSSFSAVSAALATAFIVALFVDQLVRARDSATYAEALQQSIVEQQQTEQQLRHLLDDLPYAVVMLTSDGHLTAVNRGAAEVFGREPADIVGAHFAEFLDERCHDDMLKLWVDVMDGAVYETIEEKVVTLRAPADPSRFYEVDMALPLRDPDHIVASLRDVTSSIVAMSEADRARERFRLAFDDAPIGMVLASAPDGVIVDVNGPLVAMLRTTPAELIGRTIRDITLPEDWPENASRIDGVVAGNREGYRLEKRYLRSDGSIVWARTSVSVFADGDRTYFIGHVIDVTDERRSAEQLRWQATHDELTRLPNRAQFVDELTERLAIAPSGSTAVLFLDLDNFKVVNDSLGHATGDQLLRGMTQRLTALLRDGDVLSRFGGDEFVVMLTNYTGDDSPLATAERLRREVTRPMTIDGTELFVSCSIGIAIADRLDSTADELLRDADAAMYRAKARGRDCVEMFDPGVHDATVAVLRTSTELRRGIERNEIVPYFQPIVDLASGVVTGFEVLARWRHPDRGLLGADQFLPMAEESGLISDLGASVLRSSLMQLGRWRERSSSLADVSISVNVASRQLLEGGFVDIVSEALAEAGVPAGSLWLEITETALMSDVKAASLALRQLRSIGLHLAVDDFGTGYSSLTYLKRFPVETIKVDRSFVNGLGIDAEDTTIVEAVINLGHSLGLTVVAEGVETPLQLSRLRDLRCDRGQGYLFGRPRPAEIIEAERNLT